MLRGIKYALALLFGGAGLVRLVSGPRVGSPLGWWEGLGGIAWALDTLLLVAAGVGWFVWARRGRLSTSRVDVPGTTAPGATGISRRPTRGPLVATVLITVLVIGVGTVAAIDTGLSNGYSHLVIDQEAQPASTIEMATGFYDIEVTATPICGDGNAYQACAYMHLAMWQTACANRQLTIAGLQTCNELWDFANDTTNRSDECGSGCNTQASADGRWGWTYIRPVMQFSSITADDALPMIGHEEHCYFVLGNLTVGNCPGPEYAS